jgi:hypothetical protein
MNDFETRVLEDLAELKTDMKWIRGGDGHEGRLQQMAKQVEKHEVFLQRARGWGAAFACLLTILHLGIDFLKMHWGK